MIVMIVVACYTSVLDMNVCFFGFLPLSVVKSVCGGVVGGGGIRGDDCVTSRGGFFCVGICGEYNIHYKPPQPISRIQKRYGSQTQIE